MLKPEPLAISGLKNRPSKLLACVSYKVSCHCILATMTLHERETMESPWKPRQQTFNNPPATYVKPLETLRTFAGNLRKPSQHLRKPSGKPIGNPRKPETKTQKPIGNPLRTEPIHPLGKYKGLMQEERGVPTQRRVGSNQASQGIILRVFCKG